MARRRLARGFTAAERGNRERARGSHRDRLGNKGATEAAPLILASAANRYPLRRLRSWAPDHQVWLLLSYYGLSPELLVSAGEWLVEKQWREIVGPGKHPPSIWVNALAYDDFDTAVLRFMHARTCWHQ